MWNIIDPFFVMLESLLEFAIGPIEPLIGYLFEYGIREFILQTTCYASVLALIVILIHSRFKSVVSPRYIKIMWVLIGLRLAVPFVPETSVSLFNVFSQNPKIVESEPFLDGTERTLTARIVPGSPFPVLEPVLSHASNYENHPQKYVLLMALGTLIWLAGSLFFFVQPLIANWRMNRRLRKVIPSSDDRLNSLLTEMRELMKCNDKIPILVTDEIPFPALLGMIHPAILLPTDIAKTGSDEELRMIFAHELAHYKRRDIALNWGLATIRVVHWINPIFWLIASKVKKFGELTCDADVLKTLGADKARAYGETLIQVAQRNPNCKRRNFIMPVGLTGIHSQKGNHKFLKERIKQLNYSKQAPTRMKKVLSWSFILFFVVVGMTNSAEKQLSKEEIQRTQDRPHHLTIQVELPKQSADEFIKPDKTDESQQIVMVYSVDNLIPISKDKELNDKAFAKLKDAIISAVGKENLRIVVDKTKDRKQNRLIVVATDENHDWIMKLLKEDGIKRILEVPRIMAPPIEQQKQPDPKSPETTNTKESLKLLVYPVEDLILDSEDKTKEALTKLKDAIITNVGKKDLTILENLRTKSFVIRATDEKHELIREQILFWRKHGWCAIRMQVKMISVPKKRLAQFQDRLDNELLKEIPFSPGLFAQMTNKHPELYSVSKPGKFPVNTTRKEFSPEWITILSPKQKRDFDNILQGEGRANIIAAPVLTAFSGTLTSISDTVERPYIVIIKSGTDKNNKPANVSAIEFIEEGLKILARPTYVKNTNLIQLNLAIRKNHVLEIGTRTLKPFEIPVKAPGKTFTVQIPEVESLIIQGQTDLKDGHSLLMATGMNFHNSKGEDKIYLLMTCELDPLYIKVTKREKNTNELEEEEFLIGVDQ